jgi:hypothetical protein
MNYFPDKKDNSFYFHIYDEAYENIRVPNTPLENRNDNLIDFNDFKTTNFKRNKLSIHESGYIHSTDNYGNRFKDGIRGIPYNEIDKSLLILILAPKKIENLIEIENPNIKPRIQFDLPSEIEPFTIHFEVYRKAKKNKLTTLNPLSLTGNHILAEFTSKDFGLRIYIQRIKGPAAWPPFNLILTRIR